MLRRKPRSPEESHLVERASQVLAVGTLGNLYLPMEEALLIRGGKGARIWDVSGNEYVDYLLGSGPMVLGHAHPAVVRAIQEQAERGTTFFATNEPVVLLAEEIAQAVPCAEKVRFVSTGSEATFMALRIARAYTGRDQVLKFEGGFHGMSDYALMSTFVQTPPPFPAPHPDSGGIPRSLLREVLIAPFNDLETTADLVARHHQDLAAVIVEPFQRVIPPKPGFLQGLREVTRQYGVPLVFDEVVTGFRFAYGGAQEYYGVVPDLACFGKVLGGGLPLAAVAGREEVMAVLDPQRAKPGQFVPQIGTLSGNPLAAVAGLATLKELRKPGTYQRLFAIGRRVRQGLQQALQASEIEAQVVGEDPLFDVYFTSEPITDYRSTLKADARQGRRFTDLLRERGVFKGPTKFYISLAHTEEDIRETLEAFASAAEVLAHNRG